MKNKTTLAMAIKAPSDQKTLDRFWKSADRTGDCWIWNGAVNTGGYGSFKCHRKTVSAHRLAYAIFHGSVPDAAFVCHRCDNPRCIKPAHLFLGDALVNNRDKISKGRGYIFDAELHLGVKNPNARLNANIVWKLLVLRSMGWKLKDLAKAFEVSHQNVWAITKAGNYWTRIARHLWPSWSGMAAKVCTNRGTVEA